MKLCASSKFPFVRLRDCGEIVTGSTPPKANPDFWGGEIPFVTPAQLGFQPPITTAHEYVTSKGADRGRLLPEGAVLLCCIGSLGKTGIAGVPLISNQQINAIIFDPIQVDARYGYHAARSLTPLLEHFAPSTTVKIVKKSAFAEFQIPPPAPRRAEADCRYSGCGGRLAGQAPRGARQARHAPPIHLPRHVRRPCHQSDAVGSDDS